MVCETNSLAQQTTTKLQINVQYRLIVSYKM